jgi:hypothetical protein
MTDTIPTHTMTTTTMAAVATLSVAACIPATAGEFVPSKSADEHMLTGKTRRLNPAGLRVGVGSWIILIVLLSLLVATSFVVYLGWTLGNGTDVPTSGYAAMAFGVVISLAVGFGLMALLFYSSRKGYDEPPVLIAPQDDSTESKNVPEPK